MGEKADMPGSSRDNGLEVPRHVDVKSMHELIMLMMNDFYCMKWVKSRHHMRKSMQSTPKNITLSYQRIH